MPLRGASERVGEAVSAETVELIRALAGTACVCGAAKQPKMSHCRACYYSLTPAQRCALYRRVGSGYEQAYADSLLALRAKGRIA
jgi:hypothetical protein